MRHPDAQDLFLFRVDASLRIGTGHVMRCLTLAEALTARGIECIFLCRVRPGHLIEYIQEIGYTVHKIPAREDEFHTFSLGGSISEELTAVEAILVGRRTLGKKTLVIDHYSIDSQYEAEMRSLFDRIMVIDDLENREHDCDVLLDQNYSLEQTRYSKRVPAACRLLLGPSYALLRKEFRTVRQTISDQDLWTFDPRKVMVFFGGTDPDNFTGQVLSSMIGRNRFMPEIVVGAAHASLAQIESLASHFAKASVHIQTNNMAEIMARCSWFFGAGGSVTWERMCVGLTGVVIPVAENQRKFSRDLAESGYHILLESDFGSNNVSDVMGRLEEEIAMMRMRCMSLVDGEGVERVVEYLT